MTYIGDIRPSAACRPDTLERPMIPASQVIAAQYGHGRDLAAEHDLAGCLRVPPPQDPRLPADVPEVIAELTRLSRAALRHLPPDTSRSHQTQPAPGDPAAAPAHRGNAARRAG